MNTKKLKLRLNGKAKLILKTIFFELLLLLFISMTYYITKNLPLFLILTVLSLFFSSFIYSRLVYNIAINIHDKYDELFNSFQKNDVTISNIDEMAKDIDEYIDFYKSALKNYLPIIYNTKNIILGYISLHSENKSKA